MGSPDGGEPRISNQLRSIVKGISANYPELVKLLGEQSAPIARYNVGTQEEIAPREQALSSSLYDKYAPKYGEAGAGVDLSALRGAGGQSVMEAERLNRQIDPEYYASREATSGKLAQLLGGIDPNRLTGAERENTARGLARSGYQGGETNVPSNQGAINAALTYGGALDQKRNTVANAINSAAGVLPSFNQGRDVFGQGTGGARGGLNTFSQGEGFGGQSDIAGSEAGKGILDLTAGLQVNRRQLQNQKRDALDRSNETFSSMNVCCFIFLEAYNGKLPWYVRFCRDWWYNHNPELGQGYKKMAAWLVPMMRKSKIVSAAVNKLMIQPISRVGEFLVGMKDDYSKIDLMIHNTWFRIWRWYANL